MLKVLHKGIHINLDLDTTNFTGDVETDSNLAYIQALVGGSVVAIDSNGHTQLADGAAAGGLEPIGFLINDAAGYFFENKPAIASKKVASTFGNTVVVTDKIDDSLTFAEGDKLYCGTGAKVGLVTNVQPTGGTLLGIALSSASSAAPELTIAVK